MTIHLPECNAWDIGDDTIGCICERLRACEERVRSETHDGCLCLSMDAAVYTDVHGFGGGVAKRIIESVVIDGVEFVPVTRGLDYWYARDYWHTRGYNAGVADAHDVVDALTSGDLGLTCGEDYAFAKALRAISSLQDRK